MAGYKTYVAMGSILFSLLTSTPVLADKNNTQAPKTNATVNWTQGLTPQQLPANTHLHTVINQTPIYTIGRTLVADNTLRYSWPGVTLSSQITGSTIGVTLTAPGSYFNVTINDKSYILKAKPGKQNYIIATGLANKPHTINLFKRNENHYEDVVFHGWLSDADRYKQQSVKPINTIPSDNPRIQFFTDSHGAGYGNESLLRACSQDEIRLYTNHAKAYPWLTAQALAADAYSQSYSGAGIVRNWGGYNPNQSFIDFANSTLLAPSQLTNPADKQAWQWRYEDDKADLVVVELGHNDFSVALNVENKNESWVDQAALEQAWITASQQWFNQLREQYGKQTPIVVMVTALWPDDRLRPIAEALVNEQAKSHPVYYLDYTSVVVGRGCQWHPDAAEHEAISALLIEKIRSLNIPSFL